MDSNRLSPWDEDEEEEEEEEYFRPPLTEGDLPAVTTVAECAAAIVQLGGGILKVDKGFAGR